MPLEGIAAAKVLATRRAFVLLVGIVDALVSFEMLALIWVRISALDSMRATVHNDEATYSSKGFTAEGALQAFGGRLSHRGACCKVQNGSSPTATSREGEGEGGRGASTIVAASIGWPPSEV